MCNDIGPDGAEQISLALQVNRALSTSLIKNILK